MSDVYQRDFAEVRQALGEDVFRFENRTVLIPGGNGFLGRMFTGFFEYLNAHVFRHPTKVISIVLEQNGAVRLPQSVYFPKTRSARASCSADGYGSGSFRITEVLVRCLLLQGPLQIHMRAPLIDRETCREYHIVSNGMDFISTNIGDVLHEALADPVGSYEIYQRGYEHANTHLTEKATAQYVLDVVHKHDWSQPTQLDIPVEAAVQ